MQYDEETADLVLELVADGWTLERIGLIDGMPNRNLFLKWRRADAKLSARYEKAIQDRVALSFDRLSDVAMDLLDPMNDNHRGRLKHIEQSSKILIKLMVNAVQIVQGYVGSDPSKVPHIKVTFVESTEKPPAEVAEG